MSDALFDMEPVVTVPTEKLSRDRARTLRQKAHAAQGIHPLTKQRVHPDPARSCGNCAFRKLINWRNRDYPKCTLGDAMPRANHSAASDCRAWWPACPDHEWGDPSLSPDAARWVPGGAM
jgi:hypothetical protein